MSDEPINWEALAGDAGLRGAAAWMRQRGVWVGLLTPDGRALGLGETSELEGRRPACRWMKANSQLVDGPSGGGVEASGEATSCDGSLVNWAERMMASEWGESGETGEAAGILETRCHAGFQARLVPIRVEDEPVGAVYASGFWSDKQEAGSRAQLDDLERRLGDIGTDVATNVPRLRGGEIAAVEASLEVVGARAESLLASGGDRGEACRHDAGVERFEGMVGASSQMHALFDEIRTLAGSDASVLVSGENGTGKEMVARAIHRRSDRADEAFVPLNCAALSPQLVASELFGHVEGAFSGAERSRRGLLATADGGTLLLDELGDMSEKMQRQLLRFLQEGEYSPVGSNERRRADVRVIGATNRSLADMVDAGEFRRDLFFRLGVARMAVPPLRERPADIEALASHFLGEMAARHGLVDVALSEEAVSQLQRYRWPGNVRELRNAIERAVIRAEDGEAIEPEKIQLQGDDGASTSTPVGGEPPESTLPEAIEALERRMIRRALDRTEWNKTHAAEQLDVSRRTLIRKVDDYGLSPDDEGAEQ